MKSEACDVVFVFPPAHGNLGAFKNHLGVAYLRAALKSHGIATAQYRQDNPGPVHRVADEILRYRPQVVGFTVYDANFSLALALARRLKQKRSRLQVVFGGPTATFNAAQILEKHGVVDACVLGEAEETGPAIFSELLHSRHLDADQPGIAVRQAGTVLCSSPAPLVGSRHPEIATQSALDIAPSPYLSGILTDGRAGILTARGCTHHCQYCVFAALGRRTLRLHSIERVLEELDFIARHQRRTGETYPVSVHDDAFTLLPTRAKALCQAIAARDFGLDLSCITRADRLDDELLRLMRQAGFTSLAFGLESAVPSVLRATGKVRPPDWPDPDLSPERDFIAQFRESVIAAKNYGFHVGVSIILGLPSETRENGEATLRFVKQLPANDYAHNFLWVFPGTPLWNTHDRYGIGCTTDALGLSTTSDYAYDVTRLSPLPNCLLEHEARFLQLLTRDALYACNSSPGNRHGVHTAVVRSPDLKSDTAMWLGSILDVGGLVVQAYPRLDRRTRTSGLYRDRSLLSEGDAPARCYSQVISMATAGDHDRWLVTCSGLDLYRKHKPHVVSLESADGPGPLLDWISGKATAGALCDVSEYLSRPRELIGFLNQSEEKGLGSQLRSMPFPPVLKYPGRWCKGRAPCGSLTRLEVDDKGTVRTCAHGQPIGRIGDTKKVLTQRLKSLTREAERRRGCADCPNTHCPRCPFPGIDERAYCDVMTKQIRPLSFLNRVQFYSRLPVLLAVQQDRLGGD